MINIMDGHIDLKSLEIEDIIDVDVLQKFLDNFAIGMNCAAVSVNRKGEEVTSPSHYRSFCKDFIHSSTLGDNRCAVCHNQMGEEAIKLGRPYIGSCHAGLIDFAAPIIIKGEHIGTVLGGQILSNKPIESNIKKVAKELNLPDEDLWDAAQGIDIVARDNIAAAAEVLFVVVGTLAENGYKRIEMELLSKALADSFIQISGTIGMLAESAANISASQSDLGDEIAEVSNVTKEISSVLKEIAKVADKTKLIGLNASIEAARLGNDGRVFSVVAEEIRSLAENSKQTALQIDVLNNQILQKIETTIHNSDKTLGITQEQSAAMEELSATIHNLVELAEGLNSLFVE
ncbi:PocR ligand-binding domain-containing protein [Clostridium aminobutyricum]|uniref:PocR ligand-binding domain-containing protein n=1 Tax=Clostridium aminobutyricum TaxID=33953 RepID=A0A939DAY0_CLOAM|nr:PocR ligand-binding domain-containing protein [Clostridium aminobutyricum]MBN7774350.1 PocR ligand-binding domain-containing protein [Clostridium aminobutyricum]